MDANFKRVAGFGLVFMVSHVMIISIDTVRVPCLGELQLLGYELICIMINKSKDFGHDFFYHTMYDPRELLSILTWSSPHNKNTLYLSREVVPGSIPLGQGVW